MRGRTGRIGLVAATAFSIALSGALSGALAGQTLVVTSDDQADAGGLTETLAAAGDGDAIRFDPGVGAVLNAPVTTLPAPNLTITGNVNQDGDPDTVIRGGDGTVFAAPVIAWTEAGNHATFENLHFRDFVLNAAGDVNGGGILSLSSANDVAMGDLANLGFTGNAIDVGTSLRGGGLVGAYSSDGTATIGDVSGQFGSGGGGNSVTVSITIYGGGVVGAFSFDDTATIGDVSGQFGSGGGGNSVTATNGEIYGGGVVGAHGGGMAGNVDSNAEIGDITDSASFTGNTVTARTDLGGGGVVGAYSAFGTAAIGNVSGRFGSQGGGGNSVTVGNINGGGVVGARGGLNGPHDGGDSSIGDITASSSFVGNTVQAATGSLEGGGVVGVYSGSGTATIGEVSGRFGMSGGGNRVTAFTNIEGGGVVGVRGRGDSSIGDLTASSSFVGNTVQAENRYLQGGGVVGAYSLSGTATIGDVSGRFGSGDGGGNSATVSTSIDGGGVVGVRGDFANIGDITASSSFAGNRIEAENGNLQGGGVVGAYSLSGTATIGEVSGRFGNADGGGNSVAVNGAIFGGGVVGANGYGGSTIGDITASSSFVGNIVETVPGRFEGGGVVGAFSDRGTATIGDVSGQFGSVGGGGNTVTIRGVIYGGGIVGVDGRRDSSIGDITASSSFVGNRIESEGREIQGGGVVGAYSYNGTATIGDVSGRFGNADGGGNSVAVNGAIFGGGVVGANGYENVRIGDITESASFIGNTITSADEDLYGGGVVGAFSDSGTAAIGDVSGQFGSGGGGNSVTAAGDIQGGGVVGVRGDDDSTIGDITASASFDGNTITRTTQLGTLLGGGVVGGVFL